MRKGQSNKPCHGCGSTEAHWTGQVCDDCTKAIKGYTEVMAQRAAEPGTVVMYGKDREYALPYLQHTRSASPEPVAAGFLQLMRALSTSAAVEYEPNMEDIFSFTSNVDHSRQNVWRCPVRIRKDHAAVLGTTYEAVRKAINYAYAKGHQEGRNLLTSLASGRITNDEFNTAAARLEDKAS